MAEVRVVEEGLDLVVEGVEYEAVILGELGVVVVFLWPDELAY